MAPGHHSAQATCEPERWTPSKSPSSILWARSAWQFPSAEFGAPLKLQPQPGSQLQNSRYVPESFQSAMSDVALADYLPSSLSLRRAYSLRRGTSSHAPGRNGGRDSPPDTLPFGSFEPHLVRGTVPEAGPAKRT